jgi:hypothetical protein
MTELFYMRSNRVLQYKLNGILSAFSSTQILTALR